MKRYRKFIPAHVETLELYTYDELETSAAALFDGGWRTADAKELKKEYGLTDDELEVIVEKLKEYESK